PPSNSHPIQICTTLSAAGPKGPSGVVPLKIAQRDPPTLNPGQLPRSSNKNQAVIAPSVRVIVPWGNPKKSPEVRETARPPTGMSKVPVTPVVSKSTVPVPVIFVPNNAASAAALGLGTQGDETGTQIRLVKAP